MDDLDDISQPLRPRRSRDHYHVRHIAWPNTTTNGQLNSLQQSSFPPFAFQPFHRNLGTAMLDIAAAAAVTDRDLSDHKALRFQRTIPIVVHSARSSVQYAVEVVYVKRSVRFTEQQKESDDQNR
jgi:hypothetical protein